jgi:hypothetical protein
MMIMALVLAFGMALFVFVDAQLQQDSVERQEDSSFNLAEGVLNTQAFIVSRQWPTAASPAPAGGCGSGTAVAACPSPGWMAASLGGADYARGASWSTQVVDNAAPSANYYQEGVTNAGSTPTYDANGDGFVWVRGQGTVRGRTRTLVVQVRLQRTSEVPNLPRTAITAGRFSISNSGRKLIVDLKGMSASASSLRVRCSQSTSDPTCASYAQDKGQISPEQIQQGYSDGGHAIATGLVDRLRARAQADGTYYAAGTCPSSPAGGLVFIENANCSWAHISGCCNSETSPGVLFVNRGTVSFTGNNTFYGLIYAFNAQAAGRLDPAVVTLGGNTTVQGSIIVDGDGNLVLGSNGTNYIWDDRYLYQDTVLFTYGSAGVVQNSWREVTGT